MKHHYHRPRDVQTIYQRRGVGDWHLSSNHRTFALTVGILTFFIAPFAQGLISNYLPLPIYSSRVHLARKYVFFVLPRPTPLAASLITSKSFCRLASSIDSDEESFDDYEVEEFGRMRDEMWHQRSNRWVVIVDDEEPIRRAVGQFLFDRGYQVTACADVDTALKVCRSTKTEDGGGPAIPDVIVSDIRMPGKDGLEFLNIIRSDDALVGVPVVLLTAKGLTEDRIAGYDAGADAYLPKPFDPEELLTIVDNAIKRHEILNGNNVQIDDLKSDLDEIKYLLLQRGGGGVGNGWVKATNVFLTPDEREVLEYLCKGLINREIAEETHFSVRRVEQHLTSMFRKTGVSNRTELVRWAVSTGNVEI